LFLLYFLEESPRFNFEKNNFEKGFQILNKFRKESRIDPIDEKMKSDIRSFYFQKKTDSTNLTTNLLDPKFATTSLSLWSMWFVASYIFYSVLYLIPELIGKKKDNVNFSDLIHAVIFSTFFEVIGILTALMMEIEYIGRLGCFKISFVLSVICSIFCMLKFNGWIIFLHFIKGSIQISNRTLYIYTSEAYPTEIRGVALGVASSFTRVAGLLTPVVNEFLISFSPDYCFLGLFLTACIGLVISLNLKHETLNKKID